MGNVIAIDNETGSSPSVLTETGSGGLLSSGYLREKPAIEYLEDDETPVFVLTNQKRGVEIVRDADSERITSGSGYRTICLVTDRRLLVVVGDSSSPSVDGDQCLTVQLVDIEGVTTGGGRRDGSLTVTRANDRTLTVHCGSKGLDEVAEYVTGASQAWIHVENTLDSVKRKLVDATDHRDAGKYDAALETARAAHNELSEPRGAANRFDREWSGGAMIERVDQVQGRCVETLAEVRLGRARNFKDEAESRWRDDAYEDAHDAYERARAEYETVLTYDSAAVGERDEIHDERDRLDAVMTELEQAPLRTAVAFDRDASNAEAPTDAAELWEKTLEHYRTTLELDWGAEERRFDGEPDQIRERMGDVVERLVTARRTAADEAKRAGDWHVGADQYEVAIEDFEDAREQYELALEIARDRYPDAVDHLTVELEALEERIERAKAARDGEELGPVPTGDEDGEGDGEPSYDVEATIGDVDERATDDAVADEGVPSDGREPKQGERVEDLAIEERLRRLDDEAFDAVVVSILSETGWSVEARPDPQERYDIEATKETPAEERMLVTVAHRPADEEVDQSTVEECAALRRQVSDADSVMVATSSSVTTEGTRHARRRQVRLLDDECLSAIIESRDMEDVLDGRRVEVE